MSSTAFINFPKSADKVNLDIKNEFIFYNDNKLYTNLDDLINFFLFENLFIYLNISLSIIYISCFITFFYLYLQL